MAYTPTIWTDGVTPANAANMNKLENGLAAAVGIPADVVVTPATSLLIRNRFSAGDTQPAFRLLADGKMEFGVGGSTAPDTNLYRSAVNTLKTDGHLNITGQLNVNFGGAGLIAIASDGKVYFGSAADTLLYRSAAFTLYTAGFFNAGGEIKARQATATEVALGNVGPSGMSGITFQAGDTSLYRLGAGVLATNGELRAGSLTTTGILNLGAGSYIYHNSNPVGNGVILARGAGDIDQRYTLSNDGHMYWGPGVSAGIDVELRRSAAGQLRIEGGLNITTFLEFNARTPGSAIIAAAANGDTAYRYTQGNDGSMNWGPGNAAGDTQLVRSGVGELTTYGRFIVGQRVYVGTDLVVDNSGTGSKLYFGQLSDCQVYRQSANVLGISGRARIGDTLAGQVDIGAIGVGGAAAIYFGVGADANLYRISAGNLKTDGSLYMGAGAVIDNAGTGAKLYFGSAFDTYLYRAATGVLKTDGALAVAGDYATTLPASPVDGQIATLVDSLTAPTYIWRFRYVAGIADAYKWVFIGGGPLLASGAAVDSSASTSYVFVSGPTLTFPRAGIYDVEFGASFYHSGGGANAQVGLSYNNAAVADADSAGARLDSLATSAPLAMTAWRKSNWTVASATTARMLMKTNSATLSAFARQIRAVPVRVA